MGGGKKIVKIASLDERQLTVKRSEADKKKEEAAAVCLLKHHLRRLTAFASSLLLLLLSSSSLLLLLLLHSHLTNFQIQKFYYISGLT